MSCLDFTLCIYLNTYLSFFDENAFSICETKFLTIYNNCTYGGNNQNLEMPKDMSFSYLFLEYLVCWLYFYLYKLRLMFILICHMFHNQRTPCSKNWNPLKNILLLEPPFPFIVWYEQLFSRTKCLPVIINFKYLFHRFIGKCCIWSIGPSRDKISIYYHSVCSLSRHKALVNSILNIHDIIRIEDCFKLIFFSK